MNFARTASLLLLGISIVGGTTITLTSPTSPVSFLDGDEYFTDVMNDAIDFDKRRDIMWEENFYESTINVSNNTWSGNYAPGGYIMPLFQGMDGAIQIGKIGNNFPLDSSKYTQVSILGNVVQRYNPDLTSWYTLFWTHDSSYHNASWNSMAGIDGYQLRATGEVLMHPDNEYVYYWHDMSSIAEWASSAIKGIKLSSSNQVAPSVGYRSIRIFDPNTSPQLNIVWSATDLPQGVPTQPQVEIYIDSDNSGYDGNLLFRYDSGSDFFRDRAIGLNSVTIPTAALAPGEYYIYLKLYSDYDTDNSNTDTLLATSNYSAKITINAKSHIEFINPSMTSGKDYATAVLNDPWDMNQSSDIAQMYNVGGSQFTNGFFVATNGNSDPYIYLNVNTSTPVETQKYKYVTFTMRVDDTSVQDQPFGGNIKEKVATGWMSRFFWGSTGIDPKSTSNDIVLYEGIQSYSIDLTGALTPNVSDDTIVDPTLWQTYATNGYFRFDPLEMPVPTQFFLYDMKLTGNPVPDSEGLFNMEFELSDAENESVTVAFYRDNDKAGYNGTLIGNKSYLPGVHSYEFNTCGLDVGEYYIYAVMTDSAGNVSRHYAEVPINIEMKKECFDILDLYMMGIFPSIIGGK